MQGQAEDDWGIIDGGTCRAVGVGSGVTGHGGDLILIDDPVKSHREAFSAAYREMVWNWYLNDLRSRRNNLATTPQIVIGTRWHKDDLIGRILANAEPGEWLEIRIPAIAGEHDPLGRMPGESINPVRLPIRELLREKKLLGRRFDALFQQMPIDESGAMFDVDKLIEVPDVPIMAHRVRFWDRAASDGKGDWTVGVLMAYDDNGMAWIEDVVRGRWSAEEVRRTMRRTLMQDTNRYGNLGRYRLSTCFEREPGGDGKTAADDIVRQMAPFVIFADRPADNKTARASGFAIQVNAGNVRMKIAEWNADYTDELSRFVADVDNGQDDQVDASSGAFNKLAIENLQVSIR
jgi:predicted phage terminase large subunit-like protein